MTNISEEEGNKTNYAGRESSALVSVRICRKSLEWGVYWQKGPVSRPPRVRWTIQGTVRTCWAPVLRAFFLEVRDLICSHNENT